MLFNVLSERPNLIELVKISTVITSTRFLHYRPLKTIKELPFSQAVKFTRSYMKTQHKGSNTYLNVAALIWGDYNGLSVVPSCTLPQITANTSSLFPSVSCLFVQGPLDPGRC